MGVNMQALAPGQVEAAVAGGASYSTRTNDQCCQTQLAFPVMEANVAVGMSPSWSFNLHGGPAGVEPGFRFRAKAGPVDLGLLLDTGAGLLNGEGNTVIGSLGGTLYVAGEHGTFLAVGDVVRVLFVGSANPIAEDDLVLSGGFAVPVGPVTLRPEAGFVWNALSAPVNSFPEPNVPPFVGPIWEVFAGLSISIRTSP